MEETTDVEEPANAEPGKGKPQVQNTSNPRMQKANCAVLFYTKDLSIPGFWYPRGPGTNLPWIPRGDCTVNKMGLTPEFP